MKGEKIMLLAVCSGLGVLLMMAACVALAFEDVVEANNSHEEVAEN